MSDGDEKSLPAGTLDLDALRLRQDFADNLGVKKLLVQRAGDAAQQAVVRPCPAWRRLARVRLPSIQVKGNVNETYVVDPRLAANLPQDVSNVLLVTAINRQGSVFLWPLRTPNSTGHDAWALSALAASKEAEASWVRVTANMAAGAYDVVVATGMLPEPEWPEESFAQLFDLATSAIG